MEILDLTAEHPRGIEQIAVLLVEEFGGTGSESWRTLEAATTEVMESLEPARISRFVRMGYHIVGVIPDANGFGKPDVLMAKRVAA